MQRFLSSSPPTPWADAINAASDQLEAALGRRLYPLHLEACDLGSFHTSSQVHTQQQQQGELEHGKLRTC